jgi:hypothetical protein
MCGDSRGLTHAGTKCKRATEISEACHAESCPTPTSDFVCITTGADLSPSPHGQRHPVPSRTIAQCGVSKHLQRKKNTESGTMVAACGRDSRHRIGPRFVICWRAVSLHAGIACIARIGLPLQSRSFTSFFPFRTAQNFLWMRRGGATRARI